MQKLEFVYDGEIVDVALEKQGSSYLAKVGESEFVIEPVGDGLFMVNTDGTRRMVTAASDRDKTFVGIDSCVLELSEPSAEGAGGDAGDAGEKDKVFAPMPGKIVKLMVKAGDTVKEKQQVVIVEAMKMENPVLARAAGTVKAVNFAEGDQVDTDSPIVELEIEGEEAGD